MVEGYEDKNGINSLGGFVFQIDAFIYYALQLKPQESLGYEKLDDVSIRRVNDLDEKEDVFRANYNSLDSHVVIQVKRTNITQNVIEKVLMRWILFENSNSNIDNYVLFGNPEYVNNGDIKDVDNIGLYKKIKSSKDRSSKSIMKQLKVLFKDDFDNFNRIVNQIKEKYKYRGNEPITDMLVDKAKDLFHKDGVFNAVYIARIEALRSKVSYAILEAVKNGHSYTLDYEAIRIMVEDISNTLTNKCPIISFSDHKKLHPIYINEIRNLREVQQLIHCKLGDNGIVRRMHRCNYYYDYKYQLKEQGKLSKIDDIEETTFDNFEDTKESLERMQKDEPYTRLITMEDNKSNSYCPNENISKGVCIYLTKDKDIVGEKQISWKDDINEKS